MDHTFEPYGARWPNGTLVGADGLQTVDDKNRFRRIRNGRGFVPKWQAWLRPFDFLICSLQPVDGFHANSCQTLTLDSHFMTDASIAELHRPLMGGR